MKNQKLTDLEIAIKIEEIEREETMKQTAVDWLVNEVANFMGFIPTDIIEKAKKREESNLLRYGFKCFMLGCMASAILTYLIIKLF